MYFISAFTHDFSNTILAIILVFIILFLIALSRYSTDWKARSKYRLKETYDSPLNSAWISSEWIPNISVTPISFSPSVSRKTSLSLSKFDSSDIKDKNQEVNSNIKEFSFNSKNRENATIYKDEKDPLFDSVKGKKFL
ncbi:hypothetical protein AYI70_g5530 [Smittium culicis]|uniref:Uncharacterized protein n=1 Tax=Smittium culicis TaxID=133412 RepID=A0A1R1XU24_9FUNG|nr:hypothetical protein AYI70_g5530 [Smittium culicis]